MVVLFRENGNKLENVCGARYRQSKKTKITVPGEIKYFNGRDDKIK